MEQQPGPVNWAPHNPAPAPGMVRLWTWEAFAHGAECVSYFRWRQAPFAQEQYHAGLLRPDSMEAEGFHEAAEVRARTGRDGPKGVEVAQAPVALVFDYAAAWAWAVQPQGQGCDYFRLVFEMYRGLRKLGLSVDILPPDTDRLDGYRLVLVQGAINPFRCAQARATGDKGASHSWPTPPTRRPPPCRSPCRCRPRCTALNVTVARVETLRPDMPVPMEGAGHVKLWRETASRAGPKFWTAMPEGRPVTMRAGALTYLGGWPDPDFLRHLLLRGACAEAGVKTLDLPPGHPYPAGGRDAVCVFNHGPDSVIFEGGTLPPARCRPLDEV